LGRIVSGAVGKKTSGLKTKNTKSCLTDAKQGINFIVCGPDDDNSSTAVWRSGNQTISHSLDCPPSSNQVLSKGVNYAVAVCGMSSVVEQKTKASLYFDLAYSELNAAVAFAIRCDCENLSADRLHFNPKTREISFNLNTDAKAIKFESTDFEIPAQAATKNENGSIVVDVPVFFVQLNEQWQVASITAKSAFNPEINKAKKAPGK
jgi:hypothetical protein